MNKNIIYTLVLLLVSACSLPPYKPTSIKELMPVRSTLNLTQVIEIPAERSYVYIQSGKVMPLRNFNTVNIYYPYCTLHLQNPTTRNHTIMPDQFKVMKIVEWEDYPGASYRGRFMHASGKGGFNALRGSSRDDGGVPTVMYATIMSLSSARQPEVKSLVCGHWDAQNLVEPLSLKELKQALGDLIKIEMHQNKPI